MKSRKSKTVFILPDRRTVTLESLSCVHSYTVDIVSAMFVHQNFAFNEGSSVYTSESRKKSGNHFGCQKEGLFQDPPGYFTGTNQTYHKLVAFY